MKHFLTLSILLSLGMGQVALGQEHGETTTESEDYYEWMVGGNLHPLAHMKIEEYEATTFDTSGFNFDVGKILSEKWYLGGRMSSIDATKKEEFYENSLGILSIGPILTYFPMSYGPYLKLGGQWSALVAIYKDDFPDEKPTDDTRSTSGHGVTAGFGYAFDPGTDFLITIDTEYGFYRFKKNDEIDASHIQTWSAGVGLYYQY